MHAHKFPEIASGTTPYLVASERRSLAKAALASVLGLSLGFGLAACGGGESENAVNNT